MSIPSAVRRIHLEKVGSTNRECFRLAEAGESGPLWVTSDEQTEGRGRRGRAWASPSGNLYASLLLTQIRWPSRLHELSFLAGVSLRRALADVAPGSAERLCLKWPNDLLLDGAKCAGILCEGRSQTPHATAVVGLGVNLRHHPAETFHPATDFATAGLIVDPNELFASLAARMQAQLELWTRRSDFLPLAQEWAEHSHKHGDTITVRAGETAETGIFLGIAADGALRLGTAKGEKRIMTGDVLADGRGNP